MTKITTLKDACYSVGADFYFNEFFTIHADSSFSSLSYFKFSQLFAVSRKCFALSFLHKMDSENINKYYLRLVPNSIIDGRIYYNVIVYGE